MIGTFLTALTVDRVGGEGGAINAVLSDFIKGEGKKWKQWDNDKIWNGNQTYWSVQFIGVSFNTKKMLQNIKFCYTKK